MVFHISQASPCKAYESTPPSMLTVLSLSRREYAAIPPLIPVATCSPRSVCPCPTPMVVPSSHYCLRRTSSTWHVLQGPLSGTTMPKTPSIHPSSVLLYAHVASHLSAIPLPPSPRLVVISRMLTCFEILELSTLFHSVTVAAFLLFSRPNPFLPSCRYPHRHCFISFL